MVVYRIEHHLNSDYGPYCGIKLDADIVQELNTEDEHTLFVHSDDNHPNLIRDSKISNKIEEIRQLDKKGEIFFGFKSVQQYKEWFNSEERKILQAVGFNLVKYEVPDEYVAILSKQLIFIKSKAILISILNVFKTAYKIAINEYGVISVSKYK